MYILGVNISHDASCCLLKDGEIVFFHEDERFSKTKHQQHLRGIKPRGENPYKFYQYESIKKHTNFIDYIIFTSFKDPCGGDYEIIFDLMNEFKMEGIEWNRVFFRENDHHFYHASNAAFFSGFEECACLVMDGSGSFVENRYDFIVKEPFREIESIYSFNYSRGLSEKFKHFSQRGDGNFEEHVPEGSIKSVVSESGEVTEFVYSSSIGCGLLFSWAAYSLGYGKEHNEGKIMGLSSYGKKTDKYGKWFYYTNGVGKTNNNLLYELLSEKYLSLRSSDEQKDILKTLQEETKEHTIFLIKKALDMCNTNNIVLSGGYFLNCVNNYHYLKEFPEVNFFVDPIASDGGLSIGAARYLWWDLSRDQTIRKLKTLYLGEKI